MKLFLRKVDGTRAALPEEYKFIEVEGEEGALALVAYVSDSGRVTLVTPEEAERAAWYARLFSVSFGDKVIRMEERNKG